MLNIFERYNVRPTTAGAMLKVPGEYIAETELDVSDLDNRSRQRLVKELQKLGLRTEIQANNLKVTGPVEFQYSRGTDQEGRRAIWLTAEGAIVDLLSQSLAYIYATKGWNLSSGRVLREVISRTGGEVRLPDGTMIFIGESEDYASSILASDGSFVHPKFGSALAADNATVEIEDDPFK